MIKLFYSITFILFISTNLFSQTLEKFKLTTQELPKEYSLTEEAQFKSNRASIFYNQVDLIGSIIGKIKSKEIQNFISKKDSGSIIYFEFENDFDDEGFLIGFLKGFLWGSNEPSKSYPEEFIVKGKILIIYSFEEESELKKFSQDKVKPFLN